MSEIQHQMLYPYINDVTFEQYQYKHELMLKDIIPFELSISKMITQSPSLVSMHDTLVNTTTLENVFLNVIWSQYLMTNKAIKVYHNFLGSSLLTYQRFNHLKESTHDSSLHIILDNDFLNDYTRFGNINHKMVSSSSDLPKATLNIVQGIILLQLRELAYLASQLF